MIYMVCPTCNFILSLKANKYEEEKQKICSNPTMTQETKEKEISKLLLSLGLKRYCCKMRIMTYKDIVQDILPIKSE